jgi:acetyl-CoA decarbonylase/synthase complex subunit gamma
LLFRHEEKFHHPCGLGFIIEDSLSTEAIKQKLKQIKNLRFERVGQALDVNLVAVKQTLTKENFLKVLQLTINDTDLSLVLMSDDIDTLKAALEISKKRNPLIYHATKENLEVISELAREFKVPMVVSAADLESISGLAVELANKGAQDLVLDTGKKPIADKIWDLTQSRRQALKKSNRSLGYPFLVIVESDDPYEEVIETATYVSKYAGIVLMSGIEPWQVLALVTLRQNIYSDPQKPLQIEPKVYPVGTVTEKSPVLVTTNFSLTYYTVLGEVEASKIPSYIISVDTEGMSVLTAWAAEKFTPDKIVESMHKFGIKDKVTHTRLIIPGYVAVMSGDLEEKTGWQIVVGPKEAAGIPSFLKNLSAFA